MTQKIVIVSDKQVSGYRGRSDVAFVNPNWHKSYMLRYARAVFLNGEFPEIRREYEAAGIPVFKLSERPELLAALPPPPEAPAEESRDGSDEQE